MFRPLIFATLAPFIGQVLGPKRGHAAANNDGIAVAGTDGHLREIRAIVGDGDVCHSCTATLHPLGDQNHSTRVIINGLPVGFLSPAHAARYAARYRNGKRSCGAVILNGDPGDWGLGVWLDLAL